MIITALKIICIIVVIAFGIGLTLGLAKAGTKGSRAEERMAKEKREEKNYKYCNDDCYRCTDAKCTKRVK